MSSISRRLIAVDAQNLLGCSPRIASAACWSYAIKQALQTVGFRHGVDHVVIAVSPQWACTVKALVPSARLVVGKGHHGAERALCDALSDTTFIARRYSGVVIASGDHVFCASVRTLAAAGVPTTIAGLPHQTSRHLTKTATRAMWLHHPHQVLGSAATLASATAPSDTPAPTPQRTVGRACAPQSRLDIAA